MDEVGGSPPSDGCAPARALPGEGTWGGPTRNGPFPSGARGLRFILRLPSHATRVQPWGLGEKSMRRSLWRMCLVLTGLAVTLGFAACGGSSSSGTCAGSSFAGTLKTAGGVTVASLSGTACWSLTGTNDWALGLTDTNGINRIVIGRESGGPPTPGMVYPLPLVGGGSSDFALRAQYGLLVCSTAGSTGTISFTTAFAPPTVGGFITAVPLLCSTSGGQTTYLQLDVASFVATEGHVTLIP